MGVGAIYYKGDGQDKDIGESVRGGQSKHGKQCDDEEPLDAVQAVLRDSPIIREQD